MANSQHDRYSLENRLGAGGMGEVWLATDTLLNRPVAIKYLKAADDNRIKDLFLAEARTLASLNHPNITLIYDAVFDEASNRFYLVMEYVEGEPLSDIIDNWNGPLPLEITIDLITGVVKALDYAHSRGIVHRDIKPANVIIQKDGVKLTDFGIAGLISLLAEGSDFIVGTPAYISPEQIDGGGLDGRADLYSLGIMLYEMVSGQGRPFRYETQTKLFMAHLQEDPPPLKEICPDIPLAMERTIMRLLEKNPDHRFAAAGDLLDVLHSIQARQQFSQPHLQFLDPEEKPFINRTELAEIQAIWEEVQDSATPRLLAVQGETGIGKTRLVTEFLGRDIIDQGLVAIAGRCDEAGVPYAPYAEILGTIFNKNLSKSLSAQKMDDLLEQIPDLARLLNITAAPTKKEQKKNNNESKQVTASGSSGLWQKLSERVPSTAPKDVAETQWQLSKTILDILSELGEAVIFLEDAGYLDEASASLTRFLIRQGHLPLLIIAACRSDNQSPSWLNNFSGNEKSLISLAALTPPTVKVYVENLVDGQVSDEVVTLIERRSRGNPLQLEEITRHLIETEELQKNENGVWQHIQPEKLADAFLPEAVLGAFTRRIDKLSDTNREALALAALLEPGPEFEIEMWSTLLKSELPEQPAENILQEGVKNRLIRKIDEKRYIFRPADVSNALAATLTGSRRVDLHEKIASILHEAGADPILVGYHHEQAGSPTKAARYLQRAADEAISTNAPNVALTYYQRAATLLESRSTYRAIGDIERQRGNHTEAITAYERTIVLAQEAGDVEEQAKTLNSLSLTYCLNNQFQDAYQQAKRVLKLDSVSDTEQAVAQSLLGLSLWLRGQLAEAQKWGQKAVTILLDSDHQVDLADAHYRLGLIHISQGKFNQARLNLQETLKLRRTLADKIGEAHCLSTLARLVGERGDFTQALSLLDAAEENFTQNSGQDGLVEVYMNRGRVLLYQRQFNEALSQLTGALDLAKRIDEHRIYILSSIYRLMAKTNLARQALDIAKSVADDALKLAEGGKSREQTGLCQVTLAQIYTAQNDVSAAKTMYQEALTQFEEIGSLPGLIRAKMSYAQFLKQQGQMPPASTLEAEAREAAEAIKLYLP